MKRPIRIAGISLAVAVLACGTGALLRCGSGPFGHHACAELYGETGDERFKNQDETSFFGCFFARRAYEASQRRHFAEVDAWLAKQAAERPVPVAPVTFETAPNHAELLRVFSTPVCRVLARFGDDSRQFDVGLATFAEHEPVFSVSAVEAPGSADMTNNWSDVSGNHFCTNGGLSGGDCVKRFPALTQTASFSLSGSISALSARLECAHP